MDEQPKRRWFRFAFSLRTMFVVLTILGVLIGWVAWQRQVVRERWAMRAWLESQGGWIVSYADEAGLHVIGSQHSTRPRRQKLKVIERQQPAQKPLPILRRWFGDEYVEGICLTDDLAARREEIARLFPESTILPDPDDLSEKLERDQQLRVALLQSTWVELKNIPLQDALDYLKDLHGVDFQVDIDGLARAGIDSEVAVSCTAEDITLADALTKMLTPVGLTFVVREQAVTVTTEAGITQLRKSFPGLYRIEK